MIHEYTPDRFHPMDPENCKAAVHNDYGVGFHQCGRKAKKDGWCTIHHPDYIEAKRAKRAQERQAMIKAKEKRNREWREREDRRDVCVRACSGLTDAQLDALGEGGVSRLVEALMVVEWVADETCFICPWCDAECAFTLPKEQRRHCPECLRQTALAPFTTEDEGE